MFAAFKLGGSRSEPPPTAAQRLAAKGLTERAERAPESGWPAPEPTLASAETAPRQPQAPPVPPQMAQSRQQQFAEARRQAGAGAEEAARTAQTAEAAETAYAAYLARPSQLYQLQLEHQRRHQILLEQGRHRAQMAHRQPPSSASLPYLSAGAGPGHIEAAEDEVEHFGIEFGAEAERDELSDEPSGAGSSWAAASARRRLMDELGAGLDPPRPAHLRQPQPPQAELHRPSLEQSLRLAYARQMGLLPAPAPHELASLAGPEGPQSAVGHLRQLPAISQYQFQLLDAALSAEAGERHFRHNRHNHSHNHSHHSRALCAEHQPHLYEHPTRLAAAQPSAPTGRGHPPTGSSSQSSSGAETGSSGQQLLRAASEQQPAAAAVVGGGARSPRKLSKKQSKKLAKRMLQQKHSASRQHLTPPHQPEGPARAHSLGAGSRRTKSIGFCGQTAKFLLFLINLLFWCSGFALAGWGILSLIEDHKYSLSQLLVFEPSARMSLFQLLSWSFITLGCASVLAGLCGCSAILKTSRWILGLYIFLILAIFALDLATGLLAIIFQERLVANVRLRLAGKLRSDYGLQASFTAAMDYIQTRHECCGLDSHSDYDQSLWRLQRLGGFEATVARTCCHLRNTFDDQAHINPRPVNETMCQSSDVRFHQSYRYRKGCLDELERLIRHKISTFYMACAAVGALILVSLFFASCFCRSIPGGAGREGSPADRKSRHHRPRAAHRPPAHFPAQLGPAGKRATAGGHQLARR